MSLLLDKVVVIDAGSQWPQRPPEFPAVPMTTDINPGLIVLHGNRLELLRDAVFDWLGRNPLEPLEEEIFLADLRIEVVRKKLRTIGMIPNLRGISRTAPYFMNNTAATLEDMIEHYKQFFKRVAIQAPAAPLLTTKPGVTPPVIDRPFTDAEIPALLAYLRKL